MSPAINARSLLRSRNPIFYAKRSDAADERATCRWRDEDAGDFTYRPVRKSGSISVIRKTTLPLLLESVEPTAAGTQQKCEAVRKTTLRHVLLATALSATATAAEQATIHLAADAEQVDCLHVMEAADSSAPSATTSAAKAALEALMHPIEPAGSYGDSVVVARLPAKSRATLGTGVCR